MSYEILLKDNPESIELLSREGNVMEIAIGGRKYNLDIAEVENGIYSILYKNHSYNVELVPVANKKYEAKIGYESFTVDILDAEARYMLSRKGQDDDEQSAISTPMPGKVVRILVEEGQEVKAGETVIIISAMKMESEYKSTSDKKVKEILVSEGDNIEGNQPLITFE